MKNIINFKTGVNYFGDTVVYYQEQSYNVFQYNCSGAKELLEIVKNLNSKGNVCIMEEGDVYITFRPLQQYLEDMIQLNNDVAQLKINNSDCAGAEIASHYGY